MDCTRLWVIRHGETEWNTQARIQGHTDIDLNERGRWQAQQAATALQHEGLSAVYSSDLRRALHTAQAIAQACGLPLHVQPQLRERSFGALEGRTFAEVEAEQPEAARRWRQRDPDFGPPGGETLSDFHQRCTQALVAIAQQHLGHTVALVAHGGVLDAWYRAATAQALGAPRTDRKSVV